MDYEKLVKSKNARSIFIAEAGINHDGDVEKAKKMIDVAVDAGADYVKFQSFKADKLVTPNALTSTYIDKGSYKGESFKDLLTRLELTEDQHIELKEYCDSKNISFLSTAFHEKSFDFLLKLGIDVVKVASGDLTNLPFLRYMAKAQLPMIISTGMATLGEIEEAITAVTSQNNNKIILMHCISWYPADIETTQLFYMKTLKTAFGFPVGYSDHTLGATMSIAARALDAVVIEKHFTLNAREFGPDHSASIEPEEMKHLVKSIREVEQGLGSSVRFFSDKELGQRKVHRRSLVVKSSLKKGDVISLYNLTVKRPGTGIAPKYYDFVIGRKVVRDIETNELLSWQDIS